MSYGMYISAAGAHVQSERLQVQSNNLANVDTVGFKRQLSVLQARHAEAIERGEESPGSRTINDVGGGVRVAETVTDFGQGTLRHTGNATDVAIDGEGFFLVEKDNQQLLTRAGNFHVSPDGTLLTQQGHAVLSADGAPVVIQPAAPWRMSEGGVVEQAGNRTYLALVKPASLGDLVKVGENLFSPLADVSPVARTERRIKNEYLEQSSVEPALEMMDLIETSRAFEVNIRMIQNHDQMTSQLVSRLLRPT